MTRAASSRRAANLSSSISISAATSWPARVSTSTSSSSALIRRSAAASSSTTAMPAITVSRLSPISPTALLSCSTCRLNRSARPISRCCWPSSQAMRYFRPLISTLTSGTALLRFRQHLADGFHRLHQPARHVMGAVVEPLGPRRRLVQLGGEPRPLMHQALGIHLHAIVLAQPGVQRLDALVEPRHGPVEPRLGRQQAVFSFCVAHRSHGPSSPPEPPA